MQSPRMSLEPGGDRCQRSRWDMPAERLPGAGPLIWALQDRQALPHGGGWDGAGAGEHAAALWEGLEPSAENALTRSGGENKMLKQTNKKC